MEKRLIVKHARQLLLQEERFLEMNRRWDKDLITLESYYTTNFGKSQHNSSPKVRRVFIREPFVQFKLFMAVTIWI